MKFMRQFVKRILFVFSVLLIAPLLILFKICALLFSEKRAFPGFSQFLSLFPGASGIYLRKGFYWLTLKKCMPDCTITFGTFFPTQNVEIGKFVYIGANCIIADSVIADDVMLGSNVHVVSGKSTHNFADLDTPMRLQGGESRTVVIGQDSWVGNNSVIMANIGRKCIIGAGSVVTRDIEDFSVAVGNPARVIKKRC